MSPTLKFVPTEVFAVTFKKLPTEADVPTLTFEPNVPKPFTDIVPLTKALLATTIPLPEPFADIRPLKMD